jgi:uncharacterized protein DUF5676
MATPPLRLGAALAVTVGIGYVLCTLVFWVSPEAASNFMNALFHGLDFRKLRSNEGAFSLGSFAYGLSVLVAWAFMLGSVFGWIARRIDATR